MVANEMAYFCMAGSVATRPPLRRMPERVAVSFFASLRFLWIGATDDADPTAACHASSSSSSRSFKEKKQQSTHRLSSVIDAVNERKLPPELRSRPNAIRSETDIVNVVEQRIWRSMEEGHFENLPGKGKPLNLSTNPHADPSEDTLYRILSRNGCAPEWVERNKEIRSSVASWRSALKKAWASREDCKDSTWTKDSEYLKSQMRDINNKILHYNLIVPYGRQMCGLKWEKEIEKLQ